MSDTSIDNLTIEMCEPRSAPATRVPRAWPRRISRVVLWLLLMATVLPDATVFGAAARRSESADAGIIVRGAERILRGTIYIKFSEKMLPSGSGEAKRTSTVTAMVGTYGVLSLHPVLPSPVSARKGTQPLDPAGLSRVFAAAISEEADPLTVAAQIARLDGVEYAEPKRLQQICDVPNDPLLANQSGSLNRLNAFNGWSLGKGSHSVVIAVVDGGTAWRHEDLTANVHINSAEDINKNGQFDSGDVNGVDDDGNGFVDDVIGWNFANGTNDPTGLPAVPGNAAHGTAVASLACAVADNGIGMVGSSWNCALMPVNASSPTLDNYLGDTYEGIIYAYRNGATIINCSWGVYGRGSRFEQDVIDAATAAGTLIVAAGGNEGMNNDIASHYPSNYRNVLAVGATTTYDDSKATFSNFGTSIDLYAPGVSMFVALPGGGYGNGGSGTSYSSPLIAGLAGVVRTAHPSWSAAQVAGQLRLTSDPIDSLNPTLAGSLGHGRGNLARALSETHAVLEIANLDIRTPAGKDLFVQGDTLHVSIDLKNVTQIAASNIQVSLSPSSSALQVVEGSTVVAAIGSEQTVSVPRLRMRVASLSAITEVVLKLSWVFNGTERDAVSTRVMLFPTIPLWLSQGYEAKSSLYSVRATDAKTVWAAGGDGTGSNPVIVMTSDGGATWTGAEGNIPDADLYCITALDAKRAWVGTSDGKIFATTDGGQSWNEQRYPGTQSGFINGVWMFSDGRGFAQGDPAGTDGKFIVLRTTDFGATWNHLANEPIGEAGEAGWNNSFWWTDPLHGWFGTNKNKVWHTSDGGVTWTSGITGGGNSYGVAFFDPMHGCAVHDQGAVARSSDGGNTWIRISSPTSAASSAVSAVLGDSSGWFITAQQVYRTRNFGATWYPEGVYPTAGDINHISAVDTTVAYAVTLGGEILKYDLGIPPEPPPPIPSAYLLEQNYPNPFNSSSTFRFHLPSSGKVRLSVFDILGREVQVLTNDEYEAGAHDITWSGIGRASGVYLVRLIVEASVSGSVYREVRKAILLK